MVRVTYTGIGRGETAVEVFAELEPYVTALCVMQQGCRPDGPDFLALDVAVLALETTAFHFTRRPHFYDQLRLPIDRRRNDHPGLGHNAAVAAFADLDPYAARLRALMRQCQPFGRDYQALMIAWEALNTAAYHFTRDPSFYGAKADSAGLIGMQRPH